MNPRNPNGSYTFVTKPRSRGDEPGSYTFVKNGYPKTPLTRG